MTTMASYFHVLVSFENKENQLEAVFMDLQEPELKTWFLKPYRNGQNIVSGNRVLPVATLRTIHIVRTDHESKAELADLVKAHRQRIDELNSGDSAIWFLGNFSYGRNEDILDAGTDVTSNYVMGPPGAGADGLPMMLTRWFFNNVWLVAGSVAAAGIALFLGWR